MKISFARFAKQTTFIWKFLHKTSLIWKAGLAAAIAWDIAHFTGSEYPFFAPLAAILCVQVTVQDSVMKGYQRVIGIVIGVIIAYFFAKFVGTHEWSIGLMVILGLGIATFLKLPTSAVSQAGVSALLVLTVGLRTDDFSYGMYRIAETIIGAIIAVLINMLILPPDFTEQAVTSVSKAAQELADRFRELSAWLANQALPAKGKQLKQKTATLLEVVRDVQENISLARKAIKYSPLLKDRRENLTLLQQQMNSLEESYMHAGQMFEIMVEWREEGTLTDSDAQEWSSRFAQMASVIDNWRQNMLNLSQQSAAEVRFQDTYLHLEDKKLAFSLYHEAHHLLEHLNASSKDIIQNAKSR